MGLLATSDHCLGLKECIGYDENVLREDMSERATSSDSQLYTLRSK